MAKRSLLVLYKLKGGRCGREIAGTSGGAVKGTVRHISEPAERTGGDSRSDIPL